MSKIETLESEIGAIEVQLVKLRTEQQELQQSLLVPAGDVPEEIATAAKNAAVSRAKHQPWLTGIVDAIALLEQQLLPKQRMLVQLKAQLKMEQDKLRRAERLKIAQVKIQDQVEKIHDLSALLETGFWELKSLHQEFGGDYRGAQERPDGTAFGWRVMDLIQFSSAQVPEIVTLGDRFVLQSRSVDLFEPERNAARAAQLQKSAAHVENREEAHRSRQLAEAAQEKRREIEKLRGLLAQKQQELKFYEREVASFVAAGYTKEGTNLKLNDTMLGRLKAEIEELESQLKEESA